MIDQKRTVEKPWGGELVWAETKNYVGKIIFIKKNNRLSKQYHDHQLKKKKPKEKRARKNCQWSEKASMKNPYK